MGCPQRIGRTTYLGAANRAAAARLDAPILEELSCIWCSAVCRVHGSSLLPCGLTRPGRPASGGDLDADGQLEQPWGQQVEGC